MGNDKIEIYAKQVGQAIQYIELPYFNESEILFVKRLRYQKVDKIPEITKGIKTVVEIGMPDLVEPLKKKVVNLLDDTGWLMVIYDAIQKENKNQTVPKSQ